jgi:hypothetical protein
LTLIVDSRFRGNDAEEEDIVGAGIIALRLPWMMTR